MAERGRRMLNMIDGSTKPDREEVFFDGFLYIISRTKEAVVTVDEYIDPKYSIDVKMLNAEYDDPISLADIAEKYPKVCKVVFDDVLKGRVYSYGNHRAKKDAEMWELVGTTIGYA